ncbi:hypothetical protein N7478_005090 [Penicillium angulare]|uniref:uncharacterized protein n=1 Tax=Penicillium angulare TaxID=116970 RepID=UPI00253F8EF2|nr:uncharacterized protein N7478_005090 [Penicillium angulare]KAJ5279718.1 hypothetical protein N7478_005090 [Penicillium angulare]
MSQYGAGQNEIGHHSENQSYTASSVSPRPALETWNYPKSNIIKVFATFWSFVMMGANDSAYGIESHYNLTYLVVSLVFLSPLAGYALAAVFANRLLVKFGQRGMAIISPGCHLIAYIINCVQPPYPVLVVSFIFAGLGNGLADSAWNAWIGDMKNSSQILGVLHGFYGIGAVLSPLIASFMIADSGLPWNYFYYIMVGGAAIEVYWCMFAFWEARGQKSGTPDELENVNEKIPGLREVLFKKPSARITWIGAVFLLGYMGLEVALSGWIVTFMREIRHGESFSSSMTSTGFWLGITFGRVVLGFVSPLIGEQLSITIYLLLEIIFCLIIYLVPDFYAGAVAVSLQGFFLGPMFPAVVVVATKLLPTRLHVTSIAFMAAFGGGGAAVLPFAVGAIAQAKGVEVLLPFVLALSGALILLWQGIPRIPRPQREHSETDSRIKNPETNASSILPRIGGVADIETGHEK